MYDFERRKSLSDIKHRSAFSFALPIMIPMGLSFFFLGLGFGLYATSQGLPWWTAPVLASTIFAGSMGVRNYWAADGRLWSCKCFYADLVCLMGAIFSMVYLHYRDMWIWGGNGFLPLPGCVTKALQLMYLRSCPMMWMKNGSTSMYRGLIIPFGWWALL